jgi:hypothetical protein
MRKLRLLSWLGTGALLLTLAWGLAGGGARTEAQSSFAAEVAALSEPAGYFDTDNLISNERSYLEVVPELKKRGVRGGAYVGVGPDQNFSYIAAIRPEVAFIVDVRRDNLLLHLLFKSLFTLARTRIEYLALLLGRPLPAPSDSLDHVASWRGAGLDKVVKHVEQAPLDARAIALLRSRVDQAIGRTGVPLSREDFATIDRFHRDFIQAGVDLQFQSTGRPPQSHYPTYRELLLATDSSGTPGNFLASEESFQFLKSLQQRDLVIPIVGDLSGSRALAGIGSRLRQRDQRLSAFYASNVEFYLFGDGRFGQFVNNVGGMPRADHAVIIRSVFGRFSGYGGGSSQHLQPLTELVNGFAKGQIRSYGELVSLSTGR